MRIVILGKSGCGKCAAAKEKLERMGLAYTYVALDNPNGWRKQGAAKALADAAMAGMDISRPPVVVVDDEAYDYSAAMKILKARVK
jgi:glutaredoxin